MANNGNTGRGVRVKLVMVVAGVVVDIVLTAEAGNHWW